MLNKQYILSELRKCQDPAYFIRNHVYIQTAGKKALFDLYPFQEECLNAFLSNKYNIILKSRQLGLSTLMAAYIAWYMLFHNDKLILVISLTEADAKEFVRKIKYAFDFISPWVLEALGAKIILNNVHTIELSTRSRVKALAPTEDAGRGYSPSLFIVDEASKIDHMDKIWSESIFPAIQGGQGQAIINSTPYSAANFFHNTWIAAENGEIQFNPIKLPWTVHPERDEKWEKETVQHIGRANFEREYNCSFLQSGDTVIDPEDIQFIKKNCSDPEMKTESERNLWTWELPQKNHKYAVFSDTSRGDNKDYSTAVIINLNTLQIVAEFKGKIKTDSHADLLMILGYRYNTAMIVVENMATGYAVLRRIVNAGYKNIYHYNKSTGEHCSGYFDDYNDNLVLGFTTDNKTRPLAIEKLEHYLRNRVLIPPSIRFVEELENFVWSNSGKPQARQGKNDDLVITYAILSYLLEHFLIGSSGKALLDYKLNEYYSNSKNLISTTFLDKPQITANIFNIETPSGIENIKWILGERKIKEKPNLQTSIFIK